MKNNDLLAAIFLSAAFLVTACGGGSGETAGTTGGTTLSNMPPVVSVGSSMTVNAGETAILKATATDQNGDPLTYSWVQTSGKRVRLDDDGAASTTFLAPSTPGTYTFHVDVSDGAVTRTSSDITVDVLAYTGNTVRFTQNPLMELAQISDAQALQVVNNRAYVATGIEGMAIYDTSNPSSPVKLGTFTPVGFNSLHLAVAANRVAIYGLATPNHGIRIVDVSTPSNPIAVGEIVTYSLIIRTLKLSSDGLTLYVDTDYGLRIYDLTDPANPVLVTLDPAYTAKRFLSMELKESGTSKTLYMLSPGSLAGTADLHVLDVTTPTTNLATIGSLTGLGYLDSMQLVGTKLYAAGLNGELNIIDVSTPQTPLLLGTWQSTDWVMRGIKVQQNTAYVYDWLVGVAVLDVTDPSQIALVGKYDTPGRVFDISLQNNFLFVADNGVGLQVIDVTTPSQPQTVRNIGTTVNGRDVVARNGKAFLVDSDYAAGGLTAYDVSNPLAPSILGTHGASVAKSIALHGNYAVTAGGDGLNIIDVRSPAAMSLTGSYTYTFASTTYSSIALKQNYAYLGTENTPGSLHTFDISNVAKPARIDMDSIGTYEYYPITALKIDGSTIHVGTGSTLFNADLTNPANPVMGSSNSATIAGTLRDVAAVADMALVSLTSYLGNVIQLINTSALPTISKASEYAVDSNGIAVSGRHLYSNEYHEFYTGASRAPLYIFDIADSANPSLAGKFDLPDAGRKLNVSDGYVFVATKGKGLAMMQAEPVLSARYSTALVGSTLSYTVTWNEFPSSVAVEAKCIVTGGSCSVAAIDQAARSATLSWSLPAIAGNYEMAVVVGDQHSFYSTRDRVTAQ